MKTPDFGGRRVLAFESRRATEIATLISTFGGEPIVAPAVREAALDSDAEAIAFARAVIRDEFDAIVFLTGVGIRALCDIAGRAGMLDEFLNALSRTRIITRGPKPVAVLRDLRVPFWVNAREPNTWREVLNAIDASSTEWSVKGARVAVQEYGTSNMSLLDGLRERGASVTAVQAYRWEMPDDLEPLRHAARIAAAGDVDVLLITSGIQLVHFWRVVQALGADTAVRRGLSRALIASIGPSASAEIRRHGFEPAFEPSHPKMGLLVREAAELVNVSHSWRRARGTVIASTD